MNIMRRQESSVAKPAALAEWDAFKTMRELMRWDPLQEIGPLAAPAGLAGMFVPDVDVRETPAAYIFKADVPGMKEKDVEVSFTGNRLTIGGKREEEKREENATYCSCERSYGSFTRSFTLPSGTDVARAAADIKDGVLTVTVPKRPEVQPQKIAVTSGEAKHAAKA